jgi:transcriptional regulator with XRE-family HTH domain
MTTPEHTLNQAMGSRLRAARQARGFSLSRLAEQTGGHYSKSRISNYEQGLRRMSVEAALALAEALGNVSAAQLLCVEGGETPLARDPDEMQLLEAFRAKDPDGQRQALSAVCGD